MRGAEPYELGDDEIASLAELPTVPAPTLALAPKRGVAALVALGARHGRRPLHRVRELHEHIVDFASHRSPTLASSPAQPTVDFGSDEGAGDGEFAYVVAAGLVPMLSE